MKGTTTTTSVEVLRQGPRPVGERHHSNRSQSKGKASHGRQGGAMSAKEESCVSLSLQGRGRGPGQPLGLSSEPRTRGSRDQRTTRQLHGALLPQSLAAMLTSPAPNVGPVRVPLESSPGSTPIITRRGGGPCGRQRPRDWDHPRCLPPHWGGRVCVSGAFAVAG